MTLDDALSLLAIALGSALVVAMAGKRVFRASPFFFAYVCFDLAATAAGLAIYENAGVSGWYWGFFLLAFAVDLLLYFCVLVELVKNLLRFHGEDPWHWRTVAWYFAGALFLIFTLSRWTVDPGRSWLSNAYVVAMRANNTVQFAGFLALIVWSSAREFRWTQRELRIVTGLGISSFVWFIVSLLHFQWSSGPVYHRLDQLGQVGDLVSMAYWLHYFWLADQGQPAQRTDVEPDSRSESGKPGGTQCVSLAEVLAGSDARLAA